MNELDAAVEGLEARKVVAQIHVVRVEFVERLQW